MPENTLSRQLTPSKSQPTAYETAVNIFSLAVAFGCRFSRDVAERTEVWDRVLEDTLYRPAPTITLKRTEKIGPGESNRLSPDKSLGWGKQAKQTPP